MHTGQQRFLGEDHSDHDASLQSLLVFSFVSFFCNAPVIKRVKETDGCVFRLHFVRKSETEKHKPKRIHVEPGECVCSIFYSAILCAAAVLLLSLALSVCDLTGDTAVCVCPASRSHTEH